MREILFRGKRKDNGERAYGSYVHIVQYKESTDYIADEEPDQYVVIPETVGQYTGLCDKNGTKIFEGDVVTHKNYAFDVYYNTEYAGFYPFYDADSGAGYGVEAKNCEIIGNVFDNSLEELQNGNQRISKRQWRIGTGRKNDK